MINYAVKWQTNYGKNRFDNHRIEFNNPEDAKQFKELLKRSTTYTGNVTIEVHGTLEGQ